MSSLDSTMYHSKGFNTDTENQVIYQRDSIDLNTSKRIYRRRSLNEEALPPLQPYFYDDLGHLRTNPLPYILTATTQTSKPLKYRAETTRLKRRSETPKTVSNNAMRKIKPNLLGLTEVKLLGETMFHREIFIIKDGTKTYKKQEIKGFKHKINCNIHLNRIKEQIDLENFFNDCQKYFKSNRKFKFLFSADGKLIQSLAEIPPHAKIVFVGHHPEFVGLIEETPTNLSLDCARIPRITIEDFQRTFTSIDSRSSRRVENMSCDFSAQNNPKFASKFTSKIKSKVLIDFPKNKIQKRIDKSDNLIELRKKLSYITVKIDKTIPKLQEQNMQGIIETYGFSESDLHKVYAQYKTFLLLSVAQNLNHDINKGINKDTLIEIILNKSQQEASLIQLIFKSVDANNVGFIDWQEFLKAMSIMSFGSLSQQIDMMFNIQGVPVNGKLSFQDVKKLCNLKLQFSKQDEISDYLSEGFARIIYDLAGVDENQSISSKELKSILEQRKEVALMRMFCSFDFLNL